MKHSTMELNGLLAQLNDMQKLNKGSDDMIKLTNEEYLEMMKLMGLLNDVAENKEIDYDLYLSNVCNDCSDEQCAFCDVLDEEDFDVAFGNYMDDLEANEPRPLIRENETAEDEMCNLFNTKEEAMNSNMYKAMVGDEKFDRELEEYNDYMAQQQPELDYFGAEVQEEPTEIERRASELFNVVEYLDMARNRGLERVDIRLQEASKIKHEIKRQESIVSDLYVEIARLEAIAEEAEREADALHEAIRAHEEDIDEMEGHALQLSEGATLKTQQIELEYEEMLEALSMANEIQKAMDAGVPLW